MKKIKLLTPILGLTALTGVVAPVITSCSGVGHVWLTSIDQQEKSGNTTGITYYFGLNSELYETKDIDVQVVSDNKDEFDTDWSVSGSVLSVVVKYVGEIESGATKKTTFKLRIKTVYWADEIELKGNFEAEATLDEWIVEYTKIYNKAIEDVKAEEAGETKPIALFDSSEDNFVSYVPDSMYIDLSPSKAKGKIVRKINGTSINIKLSWYDNDGKQIYYDNNNGMGSPEEMYKNYLELLLMNADVNFYINKDVNLAVELKITTSSDGHQVYQHLKGTYGYNGLWQSMEGTTLYDGSLFESYKYTFNNYRTE